MMEKYLLNKFVNAHQKSYLTLNQQIMWLDNWLMQSDNWLM